MIKVTNIKAVEIDDPLMDRAYKIEVVISIDEISNAWYHKSTDIGKQIVDQIQFLAMSTLYKQAKEVDTNAI